MMQRMSVLEEREMSHMEPPRKRAWLQALAVAIALAFVCWL